MTSTVYGGREREDRADHRIGAAISGVYRARHLASLRNAPHDSAADAQPPTLVSTALSRAYRGGRWFESTAAHHRVIDERSAAGKSSEELDSFDLLVTYLVDLDPLHLLPGAVLHRPVRLSNESRPSCRR